MAAALALLRETAVIICPIVFMKRDGRRAPLPLPLSSHSPSRFPSHSSSPFPSTRYTSFSLFTSFRSLSFSISPLSSSYFLFPVNTSPSPPPPPSTLSPSPSLYSFPSSSLPFAFSFPILPFTPIPNLFSSLSLLVLKAGKGRQEKGERKNNK